MKTIPFCPNLQAAFDLLAELNKIFPQHILDNGDANIESYSNGREQGLCLWVFIEQEMYKFSFSENRNSDDLVIYYGKSLDFSMQGNVPSEKAYREAKYFKYNELSEAAEFIVKQIKLWTPSNAERFIKSKT